MDTGHSLADETIQPKPSQAAAEGMLLRHPEGMFVPLDELRNATEFPRRDDASKSPSYIRSYFTAATTLFVYLSHRWLEPTTPHPDHPDQGSPKLKLVVEACKRLLSAMPPGFTVALWMDWMSLNQDGNPTEELGDSLQSIIGEFLKTPLPCLQPSTARGGQLSSRHCQSVPFYTCTVV